MTKEIYRTTTRKRFATVALAGIATAIPVLGMVPTVATALPGPGIAQVDRAWGSVDEHISAPPPPLWAPHGCGNGNCHNDGQFNNGCGDNGRIGNKHGCGNSGTNSNNGGTSNRPGSANALRQLSSSW